MLLKGFLHLTCFDNVVFKVLIKSINACFEMTFACASYCDLDFEDGNVNFFSDAHNFTNS